MNDVIKVGDRVRRTGYDNGLQAKLGQEALVVDLDDGGYTVEYYRDRPYEKDDPPCQEWWYGVFTEKIEQSPADAFLTDNNPKTRIGALKVPLHLVHAYALYSEACAMADGARKYGAFSWRQEKVSVSTYIGAALRHIYAYMEGEDCAEDSGAHHLGHARACFGILLDAAQEGTLIDDRPAGSGVGELFASYESAQKENNNG